MTELEIEIDDAVFNACYLPLLDDQSRYLNLYGGAGSGKSYFCAQKLIYRIISEPGHKFLCIRKVGRTIRKSMFALLKDVVVEWGLSDYFVIRETEMELYCPLTGGSIISAGLDDPEKLKSIHGVTGTWLEEPTELYEKDFNQIDLRLRGFTRWYKQHLFSYNPIYSGHWLRKRFHQQSEEYCRENSIRLLKTTYKDNEHIDDDYKRQLDALAAIDETYYKVYALGEWASPKGVIYTRWMRVGGMPSLFDEVIYGIDFGFNNATAVVEIRMKDGTPYIRVILYETGLTNSDLIEKLGSLIEYRYAPIYCDAAEPQRIAELELAGFNVYPADKAVKPGIDTVKRYELKIDETTSPEIITEIEAYSWKVDRQTNEPTDEPVKFRDHAMDAIRYAIYTHAVLYWGVDPNELPLPDVPAISESEELMRGYEWE